MNADAITETLRVFFRANPHDADAVYLFGSTASDRHRADSDVDLGVLFSTTPSPTFEGLPLDLEDALERILGRPVQVIALNNAPVDLRVRVLRDGVLVADHDAVARVRFEIATRNEAFDLEPILKRYRAAPAAQRVEAP